MEWLVNNWHLVVVCLAIGVVVGVSVKKFAEQPSNEQIASIKEWLLYAVTEAEKTLGEKTGQLKLRMVYDMAIAKFNWLSFVSFSTFSDWVDEALIEMRDMLKNDHINAVVNGK